jgi:septal ring factor EnvC (AmiA/AmiB activator)
LTKLREDNADIFSKLDAFQNEFSQKLEALVESKVETSGINFRAYTDRLFFDLETRTGTEFTRLRSQLCKDVNSSYLQLKADIVLAQSQAVSCAQSALLRVQRDTIHLNDASRLAAAAETEALEQRIELNVGDFEQLLKSVSSATGRIFNLRAHVSDQFAALKTDISDLRTQLVQTATSVPDLKPISDRVDAIAIQLAHVPAHADDDHSTHALIAKLEMELSTLRMSLLKVADKQALNKLAADVLDRAPKGETRAQFEACLADIESISTRLQKLESHTATQHGDEHKSFAGFALKSELSQLRSRFHELEVLVAGSKSGPAGAVAARHAAPTDDLKALLSRVSAVEASLATLKQSDDVDSAAYPVGHDVPALHSQLNEVQSLASAAWDLLDEAGKEIDALKAHIKSQDARIADLVTKIASFANLLGAGHDSAVHADEQSDPDDPVSRVKQRLAKHKARTAQSDPDSHSVDSDDLLSKHLAKAGATVERMPWSETEQKTVDDYFTHIDDRSCRNLLDVFHSAANWPWEAETIFTFLANRVGPGGCFHEAQASRWKRSQEWLAFDRLWTKLIEWLTTVEPYQPDRRTTDFSCYCHQADRQAEAQDGRCLGCVESTASNFPQQASRLAPVDGAQLVLPARCKQVLVP